MWWILLTFFISFNIIHYESQVVASQQSCQDPNAVVVHGCSTSCEATCAVPTRRCFTQICIIDACRCAQGYVRSESGGECILVEDCPQDLGCNGDKNAVISSCVSACPETCQSSDEVCTAVCKPLGCQCKDGYVLNKTGGTCVDRCSCDDIASNSTTR